MATVIGVRFQNAGKLFYFDPGKLWPPAGSHVVVETARGIEYGQVIMGVREVDDSLIAAPLKPILRIATEEDEAHAAENVAFQKEAYAICLKKIAEHKLDMKLVGVEQTFDNAKILFYFTANGRIDFRALVKDLASIFHTRIELRQIGVRDEAKMLGGLGPCGRPICCGTFLGDFQPVSIKMAKEQNLSLNPTKISGICGRLMCCLKFEEDHYETTRKRMPKIGKEVETPDGYGVITDINVLKETLNVRINKGDVSEIKTFSLEDVKWQRSSQPAEKRNDDEKSDDKNARSRQSAKRLLSSDVIVPEVNPASEPTQEPKAKKQEKPEKQEKKESNDWLRAVEEALSAAEKKNQ